MEEYNGKQHKLDIQYSKSIYISSMKEQPIFRVPVMTCHACKVLPRDVQCVSLLLYD